MAFSFTGNSKQLLNWYELASSISQSNSKQIFAFCGQEFKSILTKLIRKSKSASLLLKENCSAFFLGNPTVRKFDIGRSSSPLRSEEGVLR